MLCELCGREVHKLTVHHLVPKQEDGADGPTLEVCSACHRQIHALFDNKTLARELDTLDKLAGHPRMRRFLKWVRKQSPDKRVKVRGSTRRR